MAVAATPAQVLGSRVVAQQLDRAAGTTADTAVLDIGVQDTGADGARWALAIRGVDVAAVPDDELATVWTVRGAPHVHRRADLPAVAAATAPFSDADAGKRIFDAARPLKAAGIGTLEALDLVADAMRSVVTEPMVKGEVSSRVATLVPPPFLRDCRPCGATHLYEMPFRLAALRAGLELRAGTSPPVLQPIPGFVPADEVPARFDVVRGYLRLLGPATPRHVATYLDAPLKEVRARWPADAVEVQVDGEARWLLEEDVPELDGAVPVLTRLLGPYDLFLQARDRDVVVPDTTRHKGLWPVLGRPGGVLVDGAVVGTWRARKAGAGVAVAFDLWDAPSASTRAALQGGAERLAAHRRLPLAGVDIGS